MRLVGELTHPDIDFTPHYGIDRNIGIETACSSCLVVPQRRRNRSRALLPQGSYLSTLQLVESPLMVITIGRTNAPILTDGTIYILGIGTEGNGQIGDDGIGDLNGVEFGAKERFVQASTEFGAGSLLFDFQTTVVRARPVKVFGYYGDDKDPDTSGQITIRQEGGILTIERTVVPEIGSGTFTYSGAWSRSYNICRNWFWFSIRIGGIAESTTAAELVAGTSIFNGTAEESFSAQTQKILQQLHYLEQELLKEDSALLVLELLHSATIKESLLVSYFLQQVLVHSVFLVVLRRQQSNHLLQEQFLQISQVLQKQDTSKYSKTSFHLVHSHYLENSHIQRSTSHQGTLDLELLQSLDLPTRWILSERLVLVLQPSLVHRCQNHSRRSGRNSPLRYKSASALTALNQVYGYYGDDRDPAHLVLLQSLVLVLQNQYKSLVTTETTKILSTSGGFTFSNTPLVHPFVDYTPSIGIGVAVLYQTSGTSCRILHLRQLRDSRKIQRTCWI